MAHSHDHHHHGHDHHHDHAHGHSHTHGGTAASTRALKWSLGLTVVILIAEGVGGWLSNSLALLADAGHVLTDAGALGLSLFVAWLARQPGSAAKTYGYLRWEILAALINGATLLLISVWIVIEAISRFKHPEPVSGGLMMGIAILGFVVNGVAVWLLHGVREGSLNVRGAYLHVLGDMLASGGTVVAAVVIRFSGLVQRRPDRVARDDAADHHRLVAARARVGRRPARGGSARTSRSTRCARKLESIPNVESVHDLHVWTVTSGMVALSAHAIVRDAGYHQGVLEQAHDLLLEMGIHHVTVQLECEALGGRELHLHP